MTNEDKIIVRLIKMPLRVKGVVLPSPDGCYNIYLNDNLPYEQRQETLKHELDHIEQDDFYSGKPLEQIER